MSLFRTKIWKAIECPETNNFAQGYDIFFLGIAIIQYYVFDKNLEDKELCSR
jgi:hypothetical protein